MKVHNLAAIIFCISRLWGAIVSKRQQAIWNTKQIS